MMKLLFRIVLASMFIGWAWDGIMFVYYFLFASEEHSLWYQYFPSINPQILILLLIIPGVLLFLFIKKKFAPRERTPTTGSFRFPLMVFNQKKKMWVDDKPLYLRNIDNGVLIIGQPGSGKTKSIITPLLHQLVKQRCTGLVYDLKGKLCEDVLSAYQQSSDSDVTPYFVNFFKPECSHRLNPISPRYMKNKAETMEFMSSMLSNFMNAEEGVKGSDPFWFNTGKTVLTAITWFLKLKYPQYCTLPHLIAFVLANEPERIIDIIDQEPESSRMLNVLKASSQAKDKTLFINILSTLYAYLTILDLPELFWVLSKDEVDLNVNDPGHPALLTIANHEPLQKVYSPIVSLICSVVLQRMNQENRRRGAVVFDEFASIKIPGFQRTPETIRSRNVSTVVAIHDKQQLVTQYGQSIAETIYSTLATKFFFRSTNRKTVEDAVALFGKRDQYFTSVTESNSSGGSSRGFSESSNKGVSQSIQQRDYLKVEEITNYQRGEFAGIFSDANFLYTKGSRVKLFPIEGVKLPDKGISGDLISSNYLSIYRDIQNIADGISNAPKPSARELKIDF
ncbi:type IV secretion system DNA-binding domain-containing protein [Ekhidna sp.]|uniref:type IV secretory system conjugative DNA transfer family protein n=1 Tax=Ekhidna sp. TaxID=2608089 RepID=UPI0032993258